MSGLEKNFRNIPDEQKLAVYWYWMGGNMSKEGVVKDLQAMKKVGINRVQIGMIGNDQGAPQGPVKMFTDAWWDILHTMFKTAGELNIEVGLFNCPGWSQSGGPWVKPSQSMRYLAYAKDTVSGPTKMNVKLPALGKDAQDVKVLAFPLISSKVVFTPLEDASKDTTINLSSPVAAKVRSLVLYPVMKACSGSAELFVKDGENYRSVEKFQIDRSNDAINVGFEPYAPIVISVPETEGKQFRLVVNAAGIIQKVELSDMPVVERYPEKTFAKMWQTPHPMWDAYMWREQPEYTVVETLAAHKFMDITSNMKADGSLSWNVPKGKWVIMRTGMLPTGSMDGPAPEEGRGLETDKRSKGHI